jgi:transposase
LTTRIRVQAALTLIATDDTVRAGLCRRRLERVLAIDEETVQLKRQIAGLVAASGTTLTNLHRVGPLIAARFLAEVVDVRRYPNRNAFAAANGTAPLFRLIRAHRPASLQPRREPAAESGALHHRDHPDPR